MSEELSDIRKKINEIDKKLVELLDERIGLCVQTGKIKKIKGIPIKDTAREQEIYNKLRNLKLKNMDSENLISIYRSIIGTCLELEGHESSIAYLGPNGTFSEQAARIFFPDQSSIFVPCATIPLIFQSVKSEKTTYGVIPVENSTTGSISISLDLLLEYQIPIIGEIVQQIHFNLISKPGMKKENIETIISHPQGFSQCRRYLERNFPNANLVESSSTANAVALLSDDDKSVAIGPKLAAGLYKKEILEINIEDNPFNYTRFFIISGKSVNPTGDDKTSIVFSLKHEPGTLLKALDVFAKRNINLTKLESRPNPKSPFTYNFYLDFEGHREDQHCLEALNELKNVTVTLSILGSYPAFKK